MESLQSILFRLSGPFLFAIAFAAFVGLSDSAQDLVTLVRGGLVQDEVYTENNLSIDYDDNGIKNQDESSGIVNGSYVMGMICSGLTVNTVIIDETDVSHKIKISFDTKMLGSTYYVVEDVTLITPVVEARGSYQSNTAFDYNVYFSPTAVYHMEYVYADTGIIDCIIFTRE